eukprot:263360-Rhodomonas_salina.9
MAGIVSTGGNRAIRNRHDKRCRHAGQQELSSRSCGASLRLDSCAKPGMRSCSKLSAAHPLAPRKL